MYAYFTTGGPNRRRNNKTTIDKNNQFATKLTGLNAQSAAVKCGSADSEQDSERDPEQQFCRCPAPSTSSPQHPMHDRLQC
jgi:hypothetical protein